MERLFEKHHVAQEDRKIIRKFIDYKMDTEHVSDSTAALNFKYIILALRFVDKPISKLTVKDLLSGIRSIKNGYTEPNQDHANKEKPRPLALNTIRQAVINLKALMKWASRNGYSKISLTDIEENIKKPPAGKDITEVINPEDILTEDEIISMAAHSKSERDRALLLVTYESGCRIGEISRARWQDIVFERINDRETVKFYIRDSKKTQKRYARLTLAAPNLIALKNVMRPASESEFVFTHDGHEIMYGMVRKIFLAQAEAAGIKKPVNPHALRHARATNMLKQGFSESIVKKQLWNNQSTGMLKVYVSLGNDDIDRETLKNAGIKEIRALAAEKPPENHPCPNCHFINNSSVDYCGQCGSPVSEKAIQKANEQAKNADQVLEELVDLIIENPEFMEKYKKIKAARQAAK